MLVPDVWGPQKLSNQARRHDATQDAPRDGKCKRIPRGEFIKAFNQVRCAELALTVAKSSRTCLPSLLERGCAVTLSTGRCVVAAAAWLQVCACAPAVEHPDMRPFCPAALSPPPLAQLQLVVRTQRICFPPSPSLALSLLPTAGPLFHASESDRGSGQPGIWCLHRDGHLLCHTRRLPCCAVLFCCAHQVQEREPSPLRRCTRRA